MFRWTTRYTSCVLLLSVTGCTSETTATTTTRLCDDGGSWLFVPRDLDAGPADVSPQPATVGAGDAAVPVPDAATWGCYVDSDCSVFPDLPYCDGTHRCAPARTAVSCEAGTSWFPPSPEVNHTYVGSNGTFGDSCDPSGNLLAYQCASETVCMGGPNGCDGLLANTGAVIASPTRIDCLGTCQQGRCDGRCPQQGDHVTFVQAQGDGGAVIHNDSDGRMYTCTQDGSNEANCASLRAGQPGTVSALGLQGGYCTGANIGRVDLALPNVGTCGYACSILVLPRCTGP